MKKTQFGWVIVVVILLIEGLIGYATIAQNEQKALLPATIILSACILLFWSLTVTVTDEYVKFSFGIGLIHGRFKISEITSCRPITYTPMGWGIRFRPGVTLYNVSGYKAIEIQRKNKYRTIWIGTDSPDEFAAFINSKMEKLNPSV